MTVTLSLSLKKKQMETLPLSSMCDIINRDLFALCVAQRQAVVLFSFLFSLFFFFPFDRFAICVAQRQAVEAFTRHTHTHTHTPGWVVL